MESKNREPAQPIPFDPQEFGLDPNDPSDRAEVLDYAHGDQTLLGYVLSARDARQDFDTGELKVDEYYSRQDQINNYYQQRLSELGITVNPKP